MAVPGGQRFRYGNLSDAVCGVPDADRAVVSRRAPGSDGRAVRGGGVRRAEYCWHSRGGDYFPLAVFPALDAVCAGSAAFPFQIGGGEWRGCPAGCVNCGHGGIAWRNADRDVELHGVGQRFHDRAGSGAAAEDLSEGDDRGGDFGFGDVCVAVRGSVSGGRASSSVFRRRGLGASGWACWGYLAWRELARIFASAGRNDECVWDVQRAGDELFEV